MDERAQRLQAEFERMQNHCADGEPHEWGPWVEEKARQCQRCGHLMMQARSVKGFRVGPDEPPKP